MTRLFTDGAEMGDTQFWDFIDANNGMAADNTIPVAKSGEWSYKGSWWGCYKYIGVGGGTNDIYLRYRLRCNVPTMARGASILGFGISGTEMGKFSLDPICRFAAYAVRGINDDILEISNVVMQANTWYLIEIHYVLDPVVGRFEVYIDGNLEINFAGNTWPLGVVPGGPSVNQLLWANSAYCATWLDDLACNSTDGATDNSWCGDGSITKMIPNGDGAHNDWTGADGDQVNNFEQVDEYPNDGDLTYVYADGTDVGLQDQYALSDLDYTNKSVLRIWPEARARKSSPLDGFHIKLGILPSGGADQMSANRDLYSGYYSRIVGNEYKTNPVDGLAWDEADLDTLEFVTEVG